MRLWSIHPGYLDSKGLVALWRESLLAQRVLQNKTTGYRHHPQLIRFKGATEPVGAITAYLRGIADEADVRGYNFDKSKIQTGSCAGKIPVTSGQLEYEFNHLLKKLKNRDPEKYRQLRNVERLAPHPVFNERKGEVEDWEAVRGRVIGLSHHHGL